MKVNIIAKDNGAIQEQKTNKLSRGGVRRSKINSKEQIKMKIMKRIGLDLPPLRECVNRMYKNDPKTRGIRKNQIYEKICENKELFNKDKREKY